MSIQTHEGRSTEPQAAAPGELFKTEIERLVVMRLADPDVVGKQLQTHPGQVTGDGAWEERAAERGMLGDLEIENIALRSSAADPDRATLRFDVVSPGIELDRSLWEDAVPYPARPDASGSRPCWAAKVRGVQVYLGLDVDHTTLEHVTIVQH